MPHLTHFSSHPEMFQTTAFHIRNLTSSKPVRNWIPARPTKAAMPLKAHIGQIIPSFGEQQPSAWRCTNSLNPSLDPVLSLRARANQTNKSPKLAFAAAIIAASLQFFTLPGLTAEHQENLTQQGSVSNLEIVRELDSLCNDLTQEVKKLNESEMWVNIIAIIGAVSSLIGMINIVIASNQINKLDKAVAEVARDKKDLGTALIILGRKYGGSEATENTS